MVAAVLQDGRRGRPPSGPAGVAGGGQPLPGDPPAAALHVRGPRPPHQVRPHLHDAHGPAHADRRHRPGPHPRRAREAGPHVRQPARRQPHPPPLQRRQVHRQLGPLRPALARPAPQLRVRDRVPAAREGVLVDPGVGHGRAPAAAPRRARRHGRRPRHGQLPPHHLQHPRLHLLRRQDPRRPHRGDRGGAQGGDDDLAAQAAGLPAPPHAAVPAPAQRRPRPAPAAAQLPGTARARAAGVPADRRQRVEGGRGQGGGRRGDDEPARGGVRGLAVRPGAAGAREAARRGGARHALLRGHERRHRHQRHRARVGHDAPRPRPGRAAEGLRRGRRQGRQDPKDHRGRRRADALLAGGGEGDVPAAPAEPLRAVARGDPGHGAGRVPRAGGRQRGVLHGLGDGEPGDVAGPGRVAAGEVPRGRRGTRHRHHRHPRAPHDAVRGRQAHLPRRHARRAPHPAHPRQHGPGAPVDAARRRGPARPRRDLRVHRRHEALPPGRHRRAQPVAVGGRELIALIRMYVCMNARTYGAARWWWQLASATVYG